jgi:ABC-type dipeptide/oligopeptide/nickel transport system permease subunit
MTEQVVAVVRRESRILRLLKGVALLRESAVGMIGFGLVLFWVLVAILADFGIPEIVIFGTTIFEGYTIFSLAPYPPNATIMPLVPPGTVAPDGGTFYLGTDHIGRDILSRIIFGSRQVLTYAPLATFCAYLVGIPMGLAAGYRRGMTDDVLSFIANVILSFPVLVLYVIVIATIGASAVNIVLAVTFASAPGIFRIVRGLVLDLRTREYVFAAETRGETPWYIMLVEILPNARGPLIVDACLRVGYVIITIGVLGFLGLGLPPPDPDWGGMINETRQMAMIFPHMTVYPCLAISSLVLGFNLLADGLREVSLRD